MKTKIKTTKDQTINSKNNQQFYDYSCFNDCELCKEYLKIIDVLRDHIKSLKEYSGLSGGRIIEKRQSPLHVIYRSFDK